MSVEIKRIKTSKGLSMLRIAAFCNFCGAEIVVYRDNIPDTLDFCCSYCFSISSREIRKPQKAKEGGDRI